MRISSRNTEIRYSPWLLNEIPIGTVCCYNDEVFPLSLSRHELSSVSVSGERWIDVRYGLPSNLMLRDDFS